MPSSGRTTSCQWRPSRSGLSRGSALLAWASRSGVVSMGWISGNQPTGVSQPVSPVSRLV